ncbi:MAG TPA: chemotaxis protein CheB [Gammaproteobacteria bacterium]|nr:chemotaxis protein CheB [Gammaproteobacteria bacterium]
MDEAPQAAVRVALLADSHERTEFRALLENEGMEVVLDDGFELPLPESWNGADVLLVGMSEQQDRCHVQHVLQKSPLPVLLNQGGIGSSAMWQRRLVGKLQVLADRALPVARLSAQRGRPELRVIQGQNNDAAGAPWLVVLGASMGGPGAVARFLRALPDDMPVMLLLAQHISEAYQDLLAEQLDRCSNWPVAVLGEEQTLDEGQVWMVPAENAIRINIDQVARRAGGGWESAHRPDINAVLQHVAETFGTRCGAIMFSGLGQDGARGCKAVVEHGGFVWAQDAESCAIASLPDAARQACKVELTGTPEQLAQALATRCLPESARIN